ncbi:hypothetical protein CFH99_18005 [Nocardioides aromaticivorans]|uniref:DUF4190 domain-containing protein n=1 Tax=Nocardioides aromaticivorans TaxID=200618 RepID=A0ABX7PNW1_9ACTN|nr:DUF4190 domain-containing protein [Nocardioides aromaticivorans]QSR27519.1 hypothetical protein CFH99_18005 [Nocardioides aromaticivorans]
MSQWPTPGDQPGAPYGGYGGYEPGQPAARTDGVSIAAFVCALTCCAGPIGVGLGIAGIVRTKDGRRRGRRAAVTGLVLGSIGTLVLIGVLVSLVLAVSNTVLEEDAEVGQCVNTGFLGTDTDNLWEASCSEPHDAEIVAVNVATDELESRYDAGDSIRDICAGLVDDGYRSVLEDDQYRVDFATDAFSEDIEAGNWLVCYVERADGEQLDGPLAGGSSGA